MLVTDPLINMTEHPSKRPFKSCLTQDKGVGFIEENDETREVSAQLVLIRKKYDKTKENNQKKRQHLEKLQKDLETVKSAAHTTENDAQSLLSKHKELKQELTDSQRAHDEELKNNKSYCHVLDRMAKDKLALEIKANSMRTALKSAKQLLDSETTKYRKTRELKFRCQLDLDSLREKHSLDRRKTNEQLKQLERNVKQTQEAATRREQRQSRQAEITETAASDYRDSYELKLRESLCAYRFWHSVLNRKLEIEIEKASHIEEAFQKIRAATGLLNIQDIAECFLTREQTYSQLLSTVTQAEKKVKELTEQNSVARARLERMHFEGKDDSGELCEEIEEMETQLSKIYREYASEEEKLQKSVRAFDQVLNWGKSTMSTLEITDELSIEPGSSTQRNAHSLCHMFDLIYNQLEVVVKPILEKEQESRRAIELYSQITNEQLAAEIWNSEDRAKLLRVNFEAEESHDDLVWDDDSEKYLVKVEVKQPKPPDKKHKRLR